MKTLTVNDTLYRASEVLNRCAGTVRCQEVPKRKLSRRDALKTILVPLVLWEAAAREAKP